MTTNLNYVYNSGTILINGGTLTSDTSITNNNESPSLPGLIQGFLDDRVDQSIGEPRHDSFHQYGGWAAAAYRAAVCQSGQQRVADPRTQAGTLAVEAGSPDDALGAIRTRRC